MYRQSMSYATEPHMLRPTRLLDENQSEEKGCSAKRSLLSQPWPAALPPQPVGQDKRLWHWRLCLRPQLCVETVLEAEAAPEWRSATVTKAVCELEKVLFHLQFMVTHIVFLRNKYWWHFMGRTLGRCVPLIIVTCCGVYRPTDLAAVCNSDCRR